MFQDLGKTGLSVRLLGKVSQGEAMVEFENEPGQVWKIRIRPNKPYLVLCVRMP